MITSQVQPVFHVCIRLQLGHSSQSKRLAQACTPSSLACCCAVSWLSRLAEPKATSLASLKLRFGVPCKSGLVSCFIFQLVPCPPPCLVQCSPHKYLGCDFSHICPQPYHALISWHFGFSFVHVPSLVPLTVPGTQWGGRIS